MIQSIRKFLLHYLLVGIAIIFIVIGGGVFFCDTFILKKIVLALTGHALSPFLGFSFEQLFLFSHALILLLAYGLLTLGIYWIVQKVIAPLKKIEREIANRSATVFNPIPTSHVPVEIIQLIKELNSLFYRLQQEFERNQNFSSDAAHELRTPLAALKAQAQLITLAETDDERQEIVKNIMKGVDRCSHLIQQLLILSRLGQTSVLQDMQSIDLFKVSAEVIAQLVLAALEKHIEIELTPAHEEGAMITANETMIGILLRNLIDNAIRYTPAHGSIIVRISNEPQQVVLRVMDSGPGIPKELRKRVFERFYRILGSQTAGSGLGLSIVQTIAALHNAQVNLKKVPSRSGLEAEVIFPKYCVCESRSLK
ncbi:MAG: hypothetical protein A2103_00240 [Gammaproteobacteria bacterium GWF2_41_13]|nr:MAG: hypothetical protein A2103_00240 [Gammaproteobacteria bacterium GWF2_41_13]